MQLKAEEVDEFYKTGGPFTAKGLDRRFTQVAYRMREFDNLKISIGNRVVDFRSEVGIGSAVVLAAAKASWGETISQ